VRVPRCAVLIPAYNEAENVARVVNVARAASVGPVWVVDDGSGDATVQNARAAGAEVLALGRNRGKGGAVFAGAAQLDTDVLVLLDADLLGLTPEHVRALAAPVLAGAAEMTRGVFSGGRWRTTTAQRLTPQLNGQRGVVRARLLEVERLAGSRYGLEVAITEHAKRARWRVLDVPLPGVSQVMKEEKRGFWVGLGVRLRMYAEILLELFKGWARR
jgi:glycosyltransferase involved in cell wall biosynthesis